MGEGLPLLAWYLGQVPCEGGKPSLLLGGARRRVWRISRSRRRTGKRTGRSRRRGRRRMVRRRRGGPEEPPDRDGGRGNVGVLPRQDAGPLL